MATNFKSVATLLLITMLAATSAQADNYTVQLGVFKTPKADFANAAALYGQIHSQITNSGLTVITVGNYPTSADARAALLELQELGYRDAYVARLSKTTKALAVQPSIEDQSTAPVVVTSVSSEDPVEADLLAGLTDAERQNVVYLDGVLHIKEGAAFTPLRQYRDR